jgi:5-methylcytosine-specific restriction protein A
MFYKRKRHLKWREKVLRRDKYLCRECAKYGRRTSATHAHHILSVEEHPEMRYVVSNGVSLCGGCHNKIEPRTRIAAQKRRGGEAPPPRRARGKG